MSPEFDRDGTAYTISREYLLQSTDGGTTWRRLVRGLDNSGQLTSIAIGVPCGSNRLGTSSSGRGR